MDLLTLFALAVALGADAFSLSIGMGLTRISRRELSLFPGIVSLFHVFMPLTGMWAGRLFGELLGQVAGVLGGVILLIIGGRTLYKSLQSGAGPEVFPLHKAREALSSRKAPGRSISALMLLAVGVSLDALSVGFGLGTLGTGIIVAVLMMGVVAGTMTFLGLCFGRYLGNWIGRSAEIVGGLILLLIGFKIMV